MNSETDVTPTTYRLCGMGFTISGIVLVLASMSTGMTLMYLLTRNPALAAIRDQPWWIWGVGVPITLGALVGPYLLWGRWTDLSWQRRAGSLLILNLFDAVAFGLLDSEALGMGKVQIEHEWLLYVLVHLFAWIEYLLWANLATDVAEHLNMTGTAEVGHSIQRFAWVGLTLSVLNALTLTDWRTWPLVAQPINQLFPYVLLLLEYLVRTISTLQVGMLCLVTGFGCRKLARELDLPSGDDEFPSARSEALTDLDDQRRRSVDEFLQPR